MKLVVNLCKTLLDLFHELDGNFLTLLLVLSGGVLGASSGPLCLGELCGWAANKKLSNFLKNVLETGRVTLPDQSEETLNTTLWTYCSLPGVLILILVYNITRGLLDSFASSDKLVYVC